MVERLFQEVVKSIKVTDNYVPRDFQTMGGAWTRDTWRRGDITVYMEDEGYTTGLMVHRGDALVLHITQTYIRDLEYRVGDEAALRALEL